MGKMKTHRGSAKRFKRTGTGKIRRFKAFKGHLTGKKTAKRTRNLRKGAMVSTADARRIDNMIP
ncbi:ribosomal protein L35 [Aedoeadaptatus nemausensis]|uniref:Large ribosomal subunit protein bL35 n=1 Tax=Aedoeadaptatus nemausensis TaxID=2582829 RepID=A0A6V6XZ76_9FIRM|nr:50S ribosomal protein L35 [Peptoniphilus nemausensis]CAC9924694.1 ribosomal protein L35 [Peptoniphilus nemausensis]